MNMKWREMERYEWWNTNRGMKWNTAEQNKTNKQQSNGICSVIYLLHNHTPNTQNKTGSADTSFFSLISFILKMYRTYGFTGQAIRIESIFLLNQFSLMWIDLFVLYFTVKVLNIYHIRLCHSQNVRSAIFRISSYVPNKAQYIAEKLFSWTCCTSLQQRYECLHCVSVFIQSMRNLRIFQPKQYYKQFCLIFLNKWQERKNQTSVAISWLKSAFIQMHDIL